MSILGRLSQGISVVPELLGEFEKFIEEHEHVFETDDRKIEDMCKLQGKNLVMFKRKLQDLKTMEDFVRTTQLQTIESRHWKRYTENYSRVLNQKDINAYIAGEKDYVQMYEVVLEIVSMRRQYEAVVEALEAFGWQLNNVVKLRIEQLEHATL